MVPPKDGFAQGVILTMTKFYFSLVIYIFLGKNSFILFHPFFPNVLLKFEGVPH
jgi:hypothetical protein